MIRFSRADRSLVSEWWFTVDRRLLAALLVLIGIGLVVAPAASPAVAVRKGFDAFHFAERHVLFASLAVVVMLAVSLLAPRQQRRLALLLLLGAVAAMVFVLISGDEINGARRWLRLGGLSLQPSELAKPAFVVLSAWAFAESARRPDAPALAIAFGSYGLLAVLLVQQPDVGQTVLISLVWGVLLVVSGQPLTWAAAMIVAGMGGLLASYHGLDYVRLRIDRFLNPGVGDNLQVERALQSFSEGGLLGRGPGEGTIKSVLPDAHTDFVLAVIGEEYGVLACVALIALFGYVTVRPILRIQAQGDAFERLAVTGLAVMIAAQALINMGVNVGLLPAKGMTLPFVSTGGSSMLATGYAAGVLLALTRRRARLTASTAAMPRRTSGGPVFERSMP